MIIRGASKADIEEAIYSIPELIPNRLDKEGRGWRVTLRCKTSKSPYARRGHSGRRLVSACYHAHYLFMERLFDKVPDAFIKSTMATYDGVDEFKHKAPYVADRNIGSQVSPLAYGDSCGCPGLEIR